ncbi:MAG: hypothetical protein K0S39_2754 [Paenibacillus sp.]|jgi:phosphosulfolactate synthase (CoM biosynthesis protein A)|nr:hypothetical protein [Paenibacillus sp.]
MTLTNTTLAEVFQLPKLVSKPRSMRQTWLKDVGFDEAPQYNERMGLVELADFLEVAGERLDFVKIATKQVLESPVDWLRRKIETYQKNGVEPYLDHTYFLYAYKHGVVERAIEMGRSLGFRAIEFMNTFGDISHEQWKKWRQLALDNEMKIIYEHHPEKNWKRSSGNVPSTGEEIIRNVIPFFEHGAFALLIDHEELELQGSRAATEIGKVIDEFGLEKLIFEVTSPKEGQMRWHDDLIRYVSTFGPDINVANIMPSQALYVERIRQTTETR